jgi:hypothetical protein
LSSQLIVAAAMLRKAQAVYEKTLRAEYPIGAGVRWVHNKHVRSGVVIEHGRGHRLKVRNGYTEATHWIDSAEIVQAYATELGATA